MHSKNMSQSKFNLLQVQSSMLSRKWEGGYLILGLGLGLYFNWTAVEILFFLFFLWTLLGPIASRYLALLTIVFFSFVPFLLIFKRPERAEEFAIYAYYFFGMAVLRAILEVKAEQVKKKTEK